MPVPATMAPALVALLLLFAKRVLVRHARLLASCDLKTGETAGHPGHVMKCMQLRRTSHPGKLDSIQCSEPQILQEGTPHNSRPRPCFSVERTSCQMSQALPRGGRRTDARHF